MSINKDLNVDPYYDDFDETKQFNRVLFKPAKAVQARELTQLQTILQKQVERFGSNVYKEGTVISGINLTSRDDLNYIKLQDQVGFTNPAIYDEFVITDTTDANFGSTSRFILKGQSSGLVAEIVKGLNGFETQAPNLKTFFINYLNANQTTGQKQFSKGEKINLIKPGTDPFLTNPDTVKVNNVDVTFTADNSNDEYAGKSFGVSCEEGVIYQKGHFIFVERQLVIVTRYSDVPGQSPSDPNVINNVSVGFTVKENIIDSNLDSSLLDNASGFNNENAPGADRLQLVPTLVSHDTASEPTEFFALIRFVNGKPVRIRDFTEFNVLGEEMARRTYEESGNYIIDGLESSLESPVTVTNGDGSTSTVAQVSVSPGKAYVFGREVRGVSTTKLNIEPVTTTQTKSGQTVSVSYGQFYTFATANQTAGISFEIDPVTVANKTTYPQFVLYNGTTQIGTCNVSNVDAGKIYVFNIKKEAGQENATPTAIVSYADTQASGFNIATSAKLTLTNSGKLFNPSFGQYIFNSGQSNVNTVSDTVLVERVRTSSTVTLAGASRQVTIASTSTTQPVADTDTIFGVTAGASPQIYKPTSVVQNANPNGIGFSGMTVTFGAITPTEVTLFYNQTKTGTSADTLTELTGLINTKYDLSSNRATLSVPNVIEVESIFFGATDVADSDLVDVTDRFRLVNNQKDAFYDTSYIELKSGKEPFANLDNLLVTFKYLSRDNTSGNGYLTANSYSTVTSKHLVKSFSGKNLEQYNLIDSIDFRPYKDTTIFPVSKNAGRAAALSVSMSDVANLPILGKEGALFANNSVVNSTYNCYLSRIDSVVLDEYGSTLIVKGDESDSPIPPKLDRFYPLAKINIPGNTISISGENRISIQNVTNRTYTMKDIEELELRVNSLANLVQLSLAEVNAKSLIVRDANGVERFKNGILVDKFEDLRGAQLFDPKFNSAIDSGRNVAMPSIREFPLDLKIDSDQLSNVSTASDDFEDVVTLLPDATRQSIIEQPFATNFRSCVSNYYNYQGHADIYPKFDSHRDVIKNPDVNFDIDLAGPLLDLVDNLQEFIPLTKEGGNRVGQPRLVDSFVRREPVGRRGNTARFRINNFIETLETESLSATTRQQKQTLGNFVTDIQMKPFLPAKAIRIFVTGLRPNTRHYFFFDEKDVNADVTPVTGLSRYSSRRMNAKNQTGRRRFRSNISSRQVKGTAVYSNSKGELRAVFDMPGGTYYVGENDLEIVDVDQYRSIESASTSYAKATYRGYNFAINKSDVNVTTRTVDFDIDTVIVERAFQTRRRDPIAQTFRVRNSIANGANFVYISEIDVFFKRKDPKLGVTCQIREVSNGYPSHKVLPFASKTLASSAVTETPDGTTATTFKFDNPVKLKADAEYCFVVIPDANSPEYLVWTSKVGATSVSKGTTATQVAVTNDWGDGALFTSTNDSAWKSYQDEDMKFTMKKYNFSTNSGTVDLIPNDVEFLTLRDNVHVVSSVNSETGEPETFAKELVHFEVDESVYILPGVSDRTPGTVVFEMNVEGDELTTLSIQSTSENLPFTDGDYVYIEQSTSEKEKLVARIESISPGINSGSTNIVIDTPFFQAGGVNVQLCVYGEVSHYSPRDYTKLHLKESSARSNNFIDNKTPTTYGNFVVGKTYTITSLGDNGSESERTTAWQEVMGTSVVPQVGLIFKAAAATSTTLPTANGLARENSHIVYGISSGAEATITSVGSEKLSYFQSEVLIDDTTNTDSKLELYKLGDGNALTLDKPISKDENIYCLGDVRSILSKSEMIRSSTPENFRIRASLSNSGFASVSPVVDAELSGISAYQYNISSDASQTSNWVSKEVILKDELPAEGLKVVLNAYRPAGTEINVYGKFVRMENSDITTDWIALTNENADQYSNSSNLFDYREYEYNLVELSSNQPKYNAFQIRIEMKHQSAGSLNNPELQGVTTDINLFPHISDYMALALT